MQVPKECPGISVGGELFVRLSDAAKLREGWDKADERIEELHTEVRTLTTLLRDIVESYEWYMADTVDRCGSGLMESISEAKDILRKGAKT